MAAKGQEGEEIRQKADAPIALIITVRSSADSWQILPIHPTYRSAQGPVRLMRRNAANLRLFETSHLAMMAEKTTPAPATKKRKGAWDW